MMCSKRVPVESICLSCAGAKSDMGEAFYRCQAAEDVIAIGDSKEEEEAALACNIKFVKIACARDLGEIS